MRDPQVWSLLDMLEINANAFLNAATQLARLHEIVKSSQTPADEVLHPTTVSIVVPQIKVFREEAALLGARLAIRKVDRFLIDLEADPCSLKWRELEQSLSEIESRFGDYLLDVKMFAMAEHEAIFMQTADELVELEGFSAKFPNASFEVEEGSKCIALGRHTAAVFHAMRTLEIGIRALAKRLGIEDPTKAAERNWKFILGAIQGRIDELWPRSSRLPHSEGSAFESLHATLDAVRNPWRNSTMHVETIYAPHEALHILRCTAFFMVGLSRLTDEEGEALSEEEEPAIPGLADEGQDHDHAGNDED